MTTIVWFRQDLRVRDNPALAAAASRGSVLPVYILDDVTPGHWRMGAASRWWLHHSLAALAEDVGEIVLLRGDPRTIVPALVETTRALPPSTGADATSRSRSRGTRRSKRSS